MASTENLLGYTGGYKLGHDNSVKLNTFLSYYKGPWYGHEWMAGAIPIPIPDDPPTKPVDPCDLCDEDEYCDDGVCYEIREDDPDCDDQNPCSSPLKCIDGKCVPEDRGKQRTFPKDQQTTVMTDPCDLSNYDPIYSISVKTNTGVGGSVELANGYTTGVDAYSGERRFYNPLNYNYVEIEGRLNALNNENRLEYGFWNSKGERGAQGCISYAIAPIDWTAAANGADRFKIQLFSNGDFIILVSRYKEPGFAYDWVTLKQGNVNGIWDASPSGDLNYTLPVGMIVGVMGGAYITKLAVKELVEVGRDIPGGENGDYNDADYYGRVNMSDGSIQTSPTMLGYNDGYASQKISYDDGILSVYNYGILSYTAPLLYPEACNDGKKDGVLIDMILTTNTEFRTTITGTGDGCYIGDEWRLNFRNQYIESIGSGGTRQYSGSYLNKKIRIISELYKENDSSASQRFAIYYEDQGSWVRIVDNSVSATNYASCKAGDGCNGTVRPNITIIASGQNSVNIEYLRISSRQDETSVLFNGNNGTITHNITEGTITLNHYASGDTITIADRNLGATAYRGESGATAADTYGNLYQWGNNYGFPNSGTVTTSNVQVDASGNSWQNPINSSTFIYGNSNWMNPSNGELWGKTEGTEVSRQGPCPNGWHVPSKAEMDRLLSMYQSITGIPSTGGYVKFEQYLLFTYPGYRRNQDGNVASQGQSYSGAHLLTNDINQQLYYGSSWWYYNSYGPACGNPIRPFKNTTT